MTTPPPTDERTQFQVDRLAYFSDAVFAIAITLLALNIRTPAVPQASEESLRAAIGQMVPSIVGFVLSFYVISNYWRAHHRLFRWVANYDDPFVTINLLLLLFVSFIPCPTAFYSNNPNFQTPLVFYAASLGAVGLLQFALRTYVIRRPWLLRTDSPPRELLLMGRRALLIPLVCALAVAVSFASLWGARLMLIFLPFFLRVYTRLTRPKEP